MVGVAAVGVVAAGREAGIVLAPVEGAVAAEVVGALEYPGVGGAGSARRRIRRGGASAGFSVTVLGTVGALAGFGVTVLAGAQAPFTQTAQLLDVGPGQVSLGRARAPGEALPPVVGRGSIAARLRRPPVNGTAVPVAQGLAVAAAHDLAVVAGLIASIHG